MKFFDNVFDPKWIFDLTHMLSNKPIWELTNIANRKSLPNGEIGTHLLLGHNVFSLDIFEFTYDYTLMKTCKKTFDFICEFEQKNLPINEISLNLQMPGMDGSSHIDGDENETVYILMLSPQDIGEKDGGEFINDTLNQTVPFKKGRLIKFKANDIHKGLAFNKIGLARMSIKFKVGVKYE